MGRDHEVVEVGVEPVLSPVFLQVLGALAVYGADALFYVNALGKALAEAKDALAVGRVDKDMVGVGLVLEDALGAAADDNAVTVEIGLFNDILGDFDHLLRVEDGIVAQLKSGGEGCRTHGLLVEAAQPRFDVLIVAAHHIRIDMRGVGDSVDDVLVEQLPAQIFGDGLRNSASAASELPVDGQYAVLDFFAPYKGFQRNAVVSRTFRRLKRNPIRICPCGWEL